MTLLVCILSPIVIILAGWRLLRAYISRKWSIL